MVKVKELMKEPEITGTAFTHLLSDQIGSFMVFRKFELKKYMASTQGVHILFITADLILGVKWVSTWAISSSLALLSFLSWQATPFFSAPSYRSQVYP